MAHTCKFCGNPLEDGRECSCKAAVRARSSRESVVFEFPKAAAQEPEGEQASDAGGQAHHRERRASRPAISLPVRLEAVNIKNTFQEIGSFAWAVLRDPMGAAKNAKHMSPAAALTALGLQAVLFMLAAWLFAGKLLETEIGVILGRTAVPGRAVAYFLLAALLETVWLYGALFLVCKLRRSNVNPVGLLGTVAAPATLWCAVFLFICVLLLFFGVAPVIRSVYIMLLLFAQAYGLFVLNTSMRSYLPVGSNSFLMVAAAYAIHAGVVIRLVGAMLGSIAQSAWS